MFQIPTDKTHLIFDMDGTLVQLVFSWEEWVENVSNLLIDKDSKIYEDFQDKKLDLTSMLNLYTKKYPEIKDKIAQRAVKFEANYLTNTLVNDDLVNQIRTNKNRHLFLWTSNPRPTTDWVIKRTELEGRFEKIITRNDVNQLKPDPEGFQLIYDSRIPKEKYVLIGDSDRDRVAAEKAGIDFCLVDFFH